MARREKPPRSIHRLLVKVTLVCWVLFTGLYLVSHGGNLLENDMLFFVAVVLAPILPLVLLTGSILEGDVTRVLVLILLQAIEILPWLACVKWRESGFARGAALFGLGIYWCIMLLHL
jgi:hypothetical protein